MFRRLFITVFFLFPFKLPSQQEIPFQVGETLFYDVSYNLFIAGQAKLQVAGIDSVEGSPAYHIIFTVKSNPLLDRLYKIRDRIDTWLDPKELFTLKYKKKIREQYWRKEFSAAANYDDSVVVTSDTTLVLNGPLRDPYSLFYYLRTIPLSAGDEIPITTFDDNHFTDLKLMVQHKDKIHVPAGQFDCVVVEPVKEKGSKFKSKGDMTLWFSDDERKIPVKIKLKAKFGSMILKLRKKVP